MRPVILLDEGVAVPACDGARVVRVDRGGAAALNALLLASDSPVVALLENGARVTWGALDRLVRVLRGKVAVAGPSTNIAWNEQRRTDAPGPSASDAQVERYARSLALRARATMRDLAPLHSLGDFCYVARREVLLELGGADESFDPGPCWEIDLNVRADRAGYGGLWVLSAYVHRAPVAARRLEREAALMWAAKRKFQDRHCGARLRGEKQDYRDHCRGDACPNFSPRGLSVTIIVPRRVPVETALPLPAESARVTSVEDAPLVSCILPTRGRPRFLIEAVKNFLAQDYPRKELIVVDDEDAPVGALLPEDERFVLVRTRGRLPLGEKRNVACARARGSLIAHFDDDDWYPPHRLSAQVRAMAERGAAVGGTSSLYFFDARGGRAWLYSHPGARWVAGSTLVYRRSFWEAHPFAPVSIGEDSRFLAGVTAADALVDLREQGLCVAMLHKGNTSPKRLTAPLWRAVAPDAVRVLLGERRLGAYREAPGATEPPLVSCVMPTFNRPAFVALAVASFEAQSYPNKELIVVDDGAVQVREIVEGRPGVRYHRLQRRASIGDKRNVGNWLARGEVVCLWDDDDWYSSERLRYQVLPILYDEADLTGIESAFLMSLSTGEVWSVADTLHRSMFEGDVAGGTLAYRRDVAQRIRYPSTSLGEDASLIRKAVSMGYHLKRLANRGHFIYMRHDRNTWLFEAGSFIDPKAWRRSVPPPGFEPSVLAAYQAAGRV
jgi:glycosyltransferase involved in cell wall biosynthesis